MTTGEGSIFHFNSFTPKNDDSEIFTVYGYGNSFSTTCTLEVGLNPNSWPIPCYYHHLTMMIFFFNGSALAYHLMRLSAPRRPTAIWCVHCEA